MKPKTIVPLIIGLGVGFFAVKMGIDMVKKAKGAQQEQQGVLVSTKTIEGAVAITAGMIAKREVPSSLVPGDAFMDPKALVGRVTKMPIPPGVPITKGMLAPPGAQPGLGARIPPGYRAVSISVNEESAVAGFVSPGSRVDVSAVYGRTKAQSKLILTDVEVGAVGQSMSRMGPDGKTTHISKSVTLFLTPEQVQILNAAGGGRKGKLRLALRGHTKDPGKSFLSKLFEARNGFRLPAPRLIAPKPRPKPKAEAERLHLVELRRGQELQRLVFDQNGGVRRLAMSEPVHPQSASRSAASTSGSDGNTTSDTEADE